MDAIEKVARICAEWHDRTDNDQPAEKRVVDMYRSLADNLIAAFPQLALEGREETIQHRCTPGCSDREMCLRAIDNGPLTRTVYETG